MAAPAVLGAAWPTIVVFGDSVAQGCDDPHPAGGWIGWAARLAENVDLPRTHVHNVATRGASLGDVALSQVPAVRNLRPQLVMLNCGMNDALHGFDRPEAAGQQLACHLQRIFGWARSVGATTIAAAVPQAPLLERAVMSDFRRQQTLRRVNEINARLRHVASNFRAIFLDQDAMPELADLKLWSRDGIHLNAAGHAYVADAITDITRTVLGRQSIPSGSPSRPRRSR